MQVVNTGNTFKIYDDSLKTFNQLPPQAYLVNFSKMSGFFLSTFDEININEKIYGVHQEKCEKVLNTFNLFERNLGVILSGAKGIGKSLFSKLLASKAIEKGYPLLIVNSYIPGIADYLTSIQQEVVVLFDEFDKTFYMPKESGGMNDPQSEMLTLFDGLSQGKKMFIVTCNEIRQLNDYLINRPGRFHYHFRFDYPSNEEITEYLKDKMTEEAYGEIPKVVNFAQKINLNYDCLRAIAFELSLGTSFEDAIKDLNILNISRERYIVTVHLSDGTRVKTTQALDMFEDRDICFETEDTDGNDFYVTFNPMDSYFDSFQSCTVVAGTAVKIDWHPEYNRFEEKGCPEKGQRKCEHITIRKANAVSYRYAV